MRLIAVPQEETGQTRPLLPALHTFCLRRCLSADPCCSTKESLPLNLPPHLWLPSLCKYRHGHPKQQVFQLHYYLLGNSPQKETVKTALIVKLASHSCVMANCQTLYPSEFVQNRSIKHSRIWGKCDLPWKNLTVLYFQPLIFLICVSPADCTV